MKTGRLALVAAFAVALVAPVRAHAQTPAGTPGEMVTTYNSLADGILALKRTARWDYADYAFRQKIMPLSEKISMTLGDWRNGG